MKTLVNNKKYSASMMKLIAIVQLKEHGVECFFENAAAAIAVGATRSEVLEAFKKDIDKTAGVVIRAQPIIYSIKNGIVTEFDSVYNSVEEVFSSCYDKQKNTITLSGVKFSLEKEGYRTKTDFTEAILKNLFDIDKKELNGVLRTLSKYEEAKTDVEKAILYPSTILADKIIEKIVDEDIKFESFRKEMSYEDKTEFDKAFKRTGVTGVIQNSTYVDAGGVKQLASSHKRKDVLELERLLASGSFKYIEAVEVDSDGSLEKMTNLVRQVERLKLNISVKFTLKARKLGNLRARGVFFQNQLIVAEDVRDTSAIIHEIGHLIHLTRFEEDKFVNYMINKLTPMIKLDDDMPHSKTEYYKKPTEVVARACEIAALLAKEEGKFIIDDEDFEVIKSREFYTQYKGIYFDFVKFDKQTRKEMLALFELFYETSPDEVVESKFDNFIKIDTQYTKTKKELSFYEMLQKEQRKQKKELKALYALVNSENIETILANRGTASIEEVAKQILVNIGYCGNHKDRMTAPDWMEVIEDKSGVILTLLREVENTMSKKEYLLFLMDFKENAYKAINAEIFFGGFSDAFRKKLRKEFAENETPNFNDMVELKSTTLSKNIGELLDAETLLDKEFVFSLLKREPGAVVCIDATLIDMELLAEYNMFVLEQNKNDRFLRVYINKALGDFKPFMKIAVAKERLSMTHTKRLRDDKEFIFWFLATHGYENNLSFMGDSLKDDIEFAKPIVAENGKYLDFFSERVQELLDKNPEERELKKLEGAKVGYRKKVARETDSMKILDVLSRDKNYDVRAEVAKNEHAAYDTLLRLAKLKYRWVRTALASNKNTPKSVMTVLSKEDDEYVLAELSKNIAIDQKQLLKLSKNKHRWVRWSVLQNPNIQNFTLPVGFHREVVGDCIRGDEEHFHYEIKCSSSFDGSFGFFDDLAKNINSYHLDGGYDEVFVEMAISIRDHKYKDCKTDAVVKTQKTEVLQSEVCENDTEDFDSLIEQGEIVDFERTDGKGVEKVLKIKSEIKDFKSFNQYMRSNKKGYYSRIAKGFILYREYADKLLCSDTAKVASAAATIYSADMLQNFANGTLF